MHGCRGLVLFKRVLLIALAQVPTFVVLNRKIGIVSFAIEAQLSNKTHNLFFFVTH